jgi:hypothetical protein
MRTESARFYPLRFLPARTAVTLATDEFATESRRPFWWCYRQPKMEGSPPSSKQAAFGFTPRRGTSAICHVCCGCEIGLVALQIIRISLRRNRSRQPFQPRLNASHDAHSLIDLRPHCCSCVGAFAAKATQRTAAVCDTQIALLLSASKRTFPDSVRLCSIANPQQVLPLVEVAFEAHALGNLEGPDQASLDLFTGLSRTLAS